MSAPQQVENNRLAAVIDDENRETEALFQQFESGVSDPEEGRRLVGEIIYVLVRRVVLRERLVYPAIQRSLDDGDDVVDLEVLADDEVGRLLKLIADTPTTSGTFEPLVARLIEQVRERMGDEQADLLPRLGEALGAEVADELGNELARARDAAPSPESADVGPDVVERFREQVSTSTS
ncbi:MAG TPA: hemerythrin domain-containing protein [Geodermatophilus sp.]|jgi:hypothetical protein|nr:hemerythrin domain-containing protein [Geodermatophilus sp.]